jgi:SAM-dependent methyltransferase
MDPSLYHAFYEIEERHWWFVGRRAIVDSLLKKRLGDTSRERRILDVGCGTGGMLPVLSRYGRVTGIDSEPLALDYCRKRGITDVHLQESFQADGQYDVVTLFDVLEHVPDEAGFLRTVKGYLKPGGLLVVTVPAFEFLWSRHDDLNRHQRRYTKRALVDVLLRSGFAVERSSYFNTLLFPGAAAVRLMSGGGRERGGGRSKAATPAAAGSPAGTSTSGSGDEALKQLRIGGSNRALAAIFGSERHLLRRLNLPFGVSLYAIAQKNS